VVALLHIVLINANHVNLNGSRSFRVAEMVQCSVEIAGNTKEAVDNNGLKECRVAPYVGESFIRRGLRGKELEGGGSHDA